MFCSNCGKQLKKDDRFCSGCGKIVENSIITQENNTISSSVVKEDKKIKSKYKSMLLKLIIGAIAICVVLEIIFILTGEYFEVHGRVILSIITIVVYGVIANNFLNLYEKTEHKILSICGIIVGAMGFVYTTLIIWEVIEADFSNFTGKLLYALWILSIGLTHTSRLFLINFKSEIAKKVLFATNVFIFITYSMFLMLVFFEIESEFYFRILWIVGILTLFGTVATPLTNKIKQLQ